MSKTVIIVTTVCILLVLAIIAYTIYSRSSSTTSTPPTTASTRVANRKFSATTGTPFATPLSIVGSDVNGNLTTTGASSDTASNVTIGGGLQVNGPNISLTYGGTTAKRAVGVDTANNYLTLNPNGDFAAIVLAGLDVGVNGTLNTNILNVSSVNGDIATVVNNLISRVTALENTTLKQGTNYYLSGTGTTNFGGTSNLPQGIVMTSGPTLGSGSVNGTENTVFALGASTTGYAGVSYPPNAFKFQLTSTPPSSFGAATSN